MASSLDQSAKITDFAIRSFRNTADGDYIAARMAFRAFLVPQFLWSSQQTIEKYLKCILLLNRIQARSIGHDLGKALRKVNSEAPFQLKLSEASERFVKYIDQFGRYRYLESTYWIWGAKPLVDLDRTVWEVRRYCKILNYTLARSDGEPTHMLELELRRIEEADRDQPHRFPWFRGYLEKIIAKPTHPAREPFLWQNAFFGSRRRRSVTLPSRDLVENAPLAMHPDIIDEVCKYVHIPGPVAEAYRRRAKEEGAKRAEP